MIDQQPTSALKPCPFCGWRAAILINRAPSSYEICCGRWKSRAGSAELDCYITTGTYNTEAEARAVWQRREVEDK